MGSETSKLHRALKTKTDHRNSLDCPNDTQRKNSQLAKQNISLPPRQSQVFLSSRLPRQDQDPAETQQVCQHQKVQAQV